MPNKVLNTALKYFVFAARREDGSQYTPDSLQGLVNAIQNGLRVKGRTINIYEDPEFKESRICLDSAIKELARQGIGASARKPTEIISDNEEELWESKALGEDNAQQLLDTILYLTGLRFALRGGREHRALRMFANPQIMGPYEDNAGRKHLFYTEDVSKTNSGGIKQRKVIPKQVRANENQENPQRCYVRLCVKYSPCVRVEKTQSWYRENPVGHNTLAATVKPLCKASGVAGKKTNHSLRATAATRFYRGEVDEQMICKVTGHRSDAARTYKRTSDEQRRTLSDIIAKKRKQDVS